MHLLLLAITFSVLVSVLLKSARRFQLDLPQLVTWNYATATVLSLWLLQPSMAVLKAPQTPWGSLLALAVLLPSIFLVLGRSVRLAGIVRSDTAQRLSLLLSLAAAFLWFGEHTTLSKLAGLALGLAAVVAILQRPTADAAELAPRRGSLWLLGVWIGFALIDILLKRVALSGAPSLSALTACFAIAFVLMLGWQLLRHVRGQARLSLRNLGAGILLGALNFGNILCYVRAHQAMPDSPSSIFATMNIGVVVLGTLVGVFGFGERTTWWNRAGLGLAVVAIGLIAVG